MKKRFLTLILTIITMLMCIFGLVACGEEHTHTYIDTITEPTCTEQGFTTHSCACGNSYIDTYTKETGHTYIDTITEPTCTEQGFTTHSCSCGDNYKDTYIDAAGHKTTFEFYANTTDHWNLCVVCYASINTENHTWDNGIITLPPTITTTGIKTYTCSVCEKTKQEELPVVEHTCRYDTNWFTDVSSHWQECTVCGKEKNKENHTWDNGIVTLPATITTTGIKTYTCSVCEKTKQEELPVVEHTCRYDTNWFTDVSSHWQECTVCGKEKNKENHTWNSGVITQEATTTTTGIKTYTCMACEKKKYEDIPIIPHEHNYSSVWSGDDTYHWHACDSCDEMNAKAEHLWNDGIVTLPATKTSTGIKTYTCSTCENIKTETLPMLPSSNEPIYALNIAGTEYVVIGFDGNATEIVIPNTYNGLRVTSIYEKAFFNNTYVKKVTLPNTIRSIGKFAFQGCTNLAQINIPESVLFIDLSAFEGCSALNKLTFASEINESSNPLTIGVAAFKNCINLTSVNLAQYTETIGDSAFENCYSLNSITIHNNLKHIGVSAFAKCIVLSGLKLNDGLIDIGAYAFDECEAITNIVLPNTVTSVGAGAFRNAKSLQYVTLSTSMTAIANSTFQNCVNLREVELHEKISMIGISAFSCCTEMKTVRILGDVSNWSNNAFYRCENLTSLYINSSVVGTLYNENYIFYNAGINGNGITLTIGADGYIPDGLFEPLHAVNAPKITSIVIENGATEIKYFSNYNYLPYVTNITIPDSVTSIGSSAFSGCYSLTEITLPFVGATKDGTSNTYFGYIFGASSYSYNNSYVPTSLKKVTITSATSIGDWAFSNCSSLTSIEIPDSVTSIGNGAFESCSSLTEITVSENNTAYKAIDGNLYTKDGTTLIRYAIGKMATSFAIPNSVTSIGNGAFQGYRSLTSIEIPDSVTSIGDSAFRDCSSLQFNEYGNAKYLGSKTNDYFALIETKSKNFSSYTIHNDTKIIANSAFYNCSSLTSITIPDGVTTIGYDAFNNCSSLTEITLPFVGATKDGTSNTHFGYIFGASSYSYNNSYVPTSLKKVTITSATSIGYNAFYNCSSLTSIEIPDSVTSIAGSAFSGCRSLTSIVIPDSVTSIGSSAFSNCSSLETITLPFVGAKANVTSSDTYQYPFGYIFGTSSYTGSYSARQYYYRDSTSSTTSTTYYIPSSLKSVTITGGNILYGAFYNCRSLTSIVIPDGVTTIGYNAFNNCSSLTEITLPFVGATKNGTGNTYFGYIFGASSYSYNNSYVPTSLKKVTITSATSIGDWAFSNCSSLTSIEIPDSVTSIAGSAFSNCSSLQFNEYGNAKYLGSKTNDYFALIGTKSKNFSSYTIHNDTKIIANSAFSNCDSLTSIVIPDSVTSIGSSAFYDCDSLTSVTIGNNVTSIGAHAFYDCSKLTSLVFSDTSTWYRTISSYDWNNKTNGISTSVTSSSNNATYFKSTYYDYYWYKL